MENSTLKKGYILLTPTKVEKNGKVTTVQISFTDEQKVINLTKDNKLCINFSFFASPEQNFWAINIFNKVKNEFQKIGWIKPAEEKKEETKEVKKSGIGDLPF